jgi:hypothetical protein
MITMHRVIEQFEETGYRVKSGVIDCGIIGSADVYSVMQCDEEIVTFYMTGDRYTHMAIDDDHEMVFTMTDSFVKALSDMTKKNGDIIQVLMHMCDTASTVNFSHF